MGKIQQAPIPNGTSKAVRRTVSSLSRWLHIYLSMGSFFIIFFFSVTGITLNHTEWFEDQQKTTTVKGQVNVKWVNTPDTTKIARLELVELLRNKHKITGAVSEFVTDDYQCTISFNGPGYTADAFVNREDGSYSLTETRTGLFGIMNDLHKGRDSGKAWKWVIDISAVLMILVSLTGLVMLFFLKKKRVSGVLVAIAGTILILLIYWIWVP
ncbi:MAG TPA: PepSY-associated TM helix domain-containing protein [Chitinophagaceae bacterium]|nr:PepSY-associated TM helix domain-containing protein [Chitinophagaceae bacterium]